jgi:hypothetical protein
MSLQAILVFWLVAVPATIAHSYFADQDTYSVPPGFSVPLDQPQFSYTDLLQDKVRHPWPKRGKYHLVRYCYADEDARAKLECLFQKGLSMWSDALGGPPSESTGHSLYFYEIKEGGLNGKPMSCFTKGTYNPEKLEGVWNPLVPADTLAVFYKKDTQSWATAGYDPPEVNPKTSRHVMVLRDLEEKDVSVIAHEVSRTKLWRIGDSLK